MLNLLESWVCAKIVKISLLSRIFFLRLFKFLAFWDWRDTSLHSGSLALSEICDRSTTEVLINSLFMPPPHPLSLSLVSLIVSQVSDSSKHCGFPHSRCTSGEEELEVRCVRVCVFVYAQRRRRSATLQHGILQCLLYCWIRVNPKQRWHCCNFPRQWDKSVHNKEEETLCCKYWSNVVFL